jgi:hypothetical protein
MKKLALLTVVLFSCSLLSAQDIITMRNGEDIHAKVLEVTLDAVKYQKESQVDGPVYTVSKADLLMVTYKDGSRDVFADYANNPETNTLPKEEIASLAPNMKYSELKKIYNAKDYGNFRGGEKNSPALMGLCSFLIPGLGQMISGEGGRGVLQLLLSGALVAAGSALYSTGIYNSASSYSSSHYNTDPAGYYSGAFLCYAGALAVDIFSIVDAVNVAKVKNMYYEDLKQVSFNMSLTPYYDVLCLSTSKTPVAGVSLRVAF